MIWAILTGMILGSLLVCTGLVLGAVLVTANFNNREN